MASHFIGRLTVTPAFVMAIAVSGCATRGAAPRPFPGAATPPTTRSQPDLRGPAQPDSIASGVVATALALRGTQYRNGGSEPSGGFDCSGLVQWVFARHGKALPRETREQYGIGEKIDQDEVQPGDLVFFKTVGKGPSHVGIALGGGEFVHAPSSRGVVRVESYTKTEYWADRWLGVRRIIVVSQSTQ
ncbi:MAG TPA: C40 family peptidase [Vicinamibacterales bacterium]|nr:C40 family peptidase [Vicinamibacterales bacterium]